MSTRPRSVFVAGSCALAALGLGCAQLLGLRDDYAVAPSPDAGCGAAASVTGCWSARYGDSADQLGSRIAVDGQGNLLVSGLASGDAGFGGGANGPNVARAYVVKLGPDGTPVWSRHAGDRGSVQIRALVTDPAGNVFITGSYKGLFDLDSPPLPNAGSPSGRDTTDLFVAKLRAADGQTLWSHRYGDMYDEFGAGAAVDAAGNVLVTGAFANTLDFGLVNKEFLVSSGNLDAFVVKLDPEGHTLWARSFGHVYTGAPAPRVDHVGESVAVTSTAVVLAGRFQGTLDLGLAVAPLTSAGGDDLFVVELRLADGTTAWGRAFGDGADQMAEGVAVDEGGNVALVGELGGKVAFPTPCATLGGPGGPPFTFFVARLDSAGNCLWTRGLGEAEYGSGPAIASDRSGNLAVTGRFTGSLDFGGCPLTSEAADATFVAKLDPTGRALYAQSFGGGQADYSGGLALDEVGDAFVAASFQGKAEVCGEPVTSAGGFDVLVARLPP